jgi:hypothetical protein
MARRNRRRLGSTKRVHRHMSEDGMTTVRAEINKGVAALRRGSCHGAHSAILNAYEAMGASESHGRSAGQTAWLPQRALMDRNGKFNDLCIVPDKVDVGAYWSPALARARRKRRRR